MALDFKLHPPTLNTWLVFYLNEWDLFVENDVESFKLFTLFNKTKSDVQFLKDDSLKFEKYNEAI